MGSYGQDWVNDKQEEDAARRNAENIKPLEQITLRATGTNKAGVGGTDKETSSDGGGAGEATAWDDTIITSRSEYLLGAYYAIAAVGELDLYDAELKALKEKVVSKSLKLVEWVIDDYFAELIGDDKE